MPTTTGPCWAVKHPDGYYVRGDEVDGNHWPTRKEAVDNSYYDSPVPLAVVQMERPCLTLQCAECNHAWNEDYDIVFHYDTEAELEESAREAEWTKTPEGNWNCPTCARLSPTRKS